MQAVEETKEVDEEDINLARLHIKSDNRESTFRFDNKLELVLEENEAFSTGIKPIFRV